MLFALMAGAGRETCSLVDNWSLIRLAGGLIRNFDGKYPQYPGVADEASWKGAVLTLPVTTTGPAFRMADAV